jgi:hypothetical protein
MKTNIPARYFEISVTTSKNPFPINRNTRVNAKWVIILAIHIPSFSYFPNTGALSVIQSTMPNSIRKYANPILIKSKV